MPINSKVKQLYDTMKAGGADVGTEQEFNDYFLASGTQGYKNRKAVFDTFKANGADVGNSYEEFRDWLGLMPKSQASKAQQKPTTNTPVSTPWSYQAAIEKAKSALNPRPAQVPSQEDYLRRPEMDQSDILSGDALKNAVNRQRERVSQVPNQGMEKVRQEEARRQQPIVSTGTPADQHVIKNQGQWEDELVKSADELLDKKVADDVGMAIAQADEEFYRTLQSQPMAIGAGQIYQIPALEQANKASSPEKTLESLLGNATERFKEYFSQPETIEKIKQQANTFGINPDDYINQVVLPRVKSRLESAFDQSQVARYVPKSHLEYLLGEMGGSLGTLLRGAIYTKKQRRYEQAGVQRFADERGGGVLGAAEDAARMGIGMATDPLMYTTGGLAGAATKAAAGKALGGKILGEIGLKAASRFANGSVSQRMFMQAPQMMFQQGLNLGTYMGASNVINNYSVGDDTSLGNNAKLFYEGFRDGGVMGGVLGLLGSMTRGLGANIGIKSGDKGWQKALHGTEKGLYNIGALGIEGLGFHTAEELNKYLRGDDMDFSVEGTLNGAITAGVLKLTSGHNLSDVGKGIAKRDFGSRFGAKLMQFLSPDVNTGLKITDADRKALSFLGDVDTVMKSIKTKEDAAGIYKQVMENPEVPFDTKQKFSAFTVGEASNSKPIWQRLDWNEGDSVLKTRDKDGNVVDRFEFKDADERNQKIQELTDERNNQIMLNNLGKHYAKMALEMPELKAKILEKMGYEPDAGEDDKINRDIMASIEGGGVNEEVFIEALSELGKEMQASGRLMEDAFVKNFAQEYGISEEDLLKVAHKDYRDRTPEEQEMMRDFGKRLNDELNPPDQVHPEQSIDNGRAKADEAAPDEVLNPETTREVTQTLLEARKAYEDLLDKYGLNREDMEKMDYPERAQYIYDNFGDEEGAKSIIRLWNAELEHQGYFDRVREKTEEAADLMLNEMQFKGKIDGETTQDIITVRDADGNEYTLVSGDVSFKDGVMSPDSPSGMIIVRDVNGHPISMKPSQDIRLVSVESRDAKRAQLLENIQVDASNAYLQNGGMELDVFANQVAEKLSVKPKEEVKPPLAAEQSAISEHPEGEAGSPSIPVAKNGRTKLYHTVEPDVAIDDILQQPESKFVKGNNDPAVVADRRIKSANERRNKLDKKLAKRYQEQDFTQEEAEDITAWEQNGEKPKTEMGKFVAEMSEIQTELDYYDNLKQVWEKRKPRKPVIPDEPIVGEDFANVPEWVYDTPEAARQRGYKKIEGHKVSRQEEKPMPQGKEVEVQYSTKDSVKGRMTVSELDDVQGSHTMNGQKNELHFIPEAQPKAEFGADRQQKASTNATEEKFRPDLMLTFNDTQSAYQSSATQTNRRGEVIQGNGRRNLAEYIYAPGNEAVAERYRQYIMEHAEELGTTADEIAKMEKPFAHIVLDVDDSEAIRLGQFKASDLESGGKEIPEVSTVATKLGDKYGNFTNIVLRHDDPDASLAERIDSNAEESVTWLNKAGVISDTEAKTLLSDKAAARQFVKDMLTDTLFRGANDNVRSSFYELPKNIQSAIVSVVGREVATTGDTTILKEVQQSIQAFHELSAASEQFASVKGRDAVDRYRQAKVAVEDWLRQINMDGSLNTEKYSNFALELAKRYKAYTDQKTLSGQLKEYYDLVSGSTREVSMFDAEPTTDKLTREEAIKKVFDIDYKPIENKENGRQRTVSVAGDHQESQAGGRGEPGNPESGERIEGGEGTADHRGGDTVDAGEVKLQKAPIDTSDPIEAINQAAQSFNEERQQKADKKTNKKPSEQNRLIRDVIIRHLLNNNGIEVVTDAKRGQQRLDEINRRNKKLGAGDKAKTPYKPSKKPKEEPVKDNRTELQRREDLRNDNQSKVIFEHSKNHFGTTYDIREAGYVLPDGTMLDFSGRHQMEPGSDTSFLKGRRSTDHREIHSIGYERDGNTPTGISTDMSDFIRRGGIRIDDNAGVINLYMKPTKEQIAALRVLIRRNDGTVQIDFGDGWNSEHYVEYEDSNVNRIISDIERYYDEGVKPEGNIKYFKTPDGHAYGYTANGKIYIDPTIATSETPIHEYTHLWAEMKRKVSPDEWEDIKKILLKDKIIEPFIKKVEKEYSELETEDDFVEEVLTQFSGRQGAEKLRRIADEIRMESDGKFSEEQAETAVQKIKNILERFWQGVAKILGVKYTNAEDIADRVLNDLLSGLNPNEEIRKATFGRAEAEQRKAHKEAQFDVIEKSNPAQDDVHSWIRSVNDIKTYNEAIKNEGYQKGEDLTPDYTADMVKQARDTGKVTVYSSKPIRDGVFVTPSKMEAKNYAGDGNVYSKEVDLEDVAWLDPLQGQYARVDKNVKMQFVGSKGAEALDNANEDTILMDNQRIAEEMEMAGKDAKAIKLATGWERGKDGEWRYEIPDFKDFDPFGNIKWKKEHPVPERLQELNIKKVDAEEGYGEPLTDEELQEWSRLKAEVTTDRPLKEGEVKTLSDYIDAPELFKAYPELKDKPVELDWLDDFAGMYTTDGKIVLNENTIGHARSEDWLERQAARTEIKETLLHEIQHAIQEIEGFAHGDNPHRIVNSKEQGDEAYYRSAGEVEAENVVNRSRLSDRQRRKKLAEETEDYPRDEQHVYKGDLHKDMRAARSVNDPIDAIEKAAASFRKEREEKLKNEERISDSEKKERPLQEMPLKSIDRFNGEHIKGLEEYEEELRKRLEDDGVATTADNRLADTDSNRRADGFWSQRGQAKDTMEADADRLGEQARGTEDGSRLGLTQEERSDIEKKLAEIQQEKERRQQAWEDFANKYHVAKDDFISVENYLKAFDDMNTDPEAKRLMDKVVSMLNGELGDLRVKAGLKERGNHNSVFGDIQISRDWITRGVDDGEKASTLLHELLHKVTMDNIELYDIPGIRKLMGKEALSACKELYAIHDALKEKYPDIYGSKSVHEMVADMGKPKLREALESIVYDKNKNVTLWDRFKEAVKRFFGFGSGEEMAGDADKAALAALDKLMDAYNKPRSIVQRTGRGFARPVESFVKWILSNGEGKNANDYFYSEETNPDTIERLEKEPKVKVYRAMQLIDGKLYPPMAAKQNGKLVEPIELGKWEKADEHPEMADENGKFKLDKGNGKSLKAAYNPYIHTSTTMLNDQFSEAQNRPNLVVVEVEVPESELTSGYKAEKAKDSVGKMDWKAGIIQGQLSGTREVILSRWDKPVRIVPTEEVAQHIADMIKGKVEVMPSNVVTPQQRAELEKLGVKFVETDNRGFIKEGENQGSSYSAIYGKKGKATNTQMSDYAIGEYTTKGVLPGVLENVTANVTKDGKTIARLYKTDEGYQAEARDMSYMTEAYPTEKEALEALAEYQKKGNPEYRESKSSEPQPVENRDKVAAHVNTLKATFGENINVVDSVDGITNEKVRKDIEDGKEVMGWYDPKIGQVSLYMPNIPNSYEAEKTVWHETVGHKGMRQLLGEEGYKKYMTKLWLDDKNTELGEYVKSRISKGDLNIYDAVNEWLGEQAEKEVKNPYENASVWQKVREAMSDGLRIAGYKMNPSIMDVKYMTWLSEQNKKGKVSEKKKQAMLDKLMGEKYDTNTYNNKVYRNPGESVDDVEYRLQSGGGNTPLANLARQRYQNSLYTKQFAWEEAHYNYMASWKRLQDAIANGQKIPDHANALMQENELDSKVKAAGDVYVRDYCKPYQDIINECIAKINVNKPEEGYQELEDYMYMKTGLQVNRQVYVRDWLRAQKAKGKDISAQEQEWYQLKADMKRRVDNGTATLRDYYTELDEWIRANVKKKKRITDAQGNIQVVDAPYVPDEHDASGLTAFTGAADKKSYDDGAILDRVMNMENQLGKQSVDKLWAQTKRVTDFAIDTEYAGGMASKESVDAAKAQYDWYLPLRGFDEKTAEDMWSYLNNYGDGTSGKILMDRKGRKSKAETPIATAFYLGEQAIRRAARNQVKMAALRFARQFTDPTDPTSLITETDVWVHNVGTSQNPDWVVEYPNIRPDATPDEIAQDVANFKAQMEAYKQAGTAKRLKTVKTENIPYRFERNRNVSEHIIDVKVNGESKLLIVNDNPRAAQALNGILKPQATKVIAAVNRFLSQAYTSWSPTFIARNAMRDVEFASSMLSVKEGWGYTGDFSKNYAMLTLPTAGGTKKPRIFDLFMKWRRGTLDENDPVEKMFKEFVENGGVTGYVQENNIDKWHNEIMKGVKDIQKGGAIDWTKDKWKWFWEGVEKMGESVENAARFATYMTSRQGGKTHAARTIVRSVADAKEVSVNFNRKGAGWKTSTFKNSNGKVDWNTKLAAFSGQYLRDTSLFYNATVQGIMNSYKNAQKRPYVFALNFAAPPFIVGALIPWFNEWVHDTFDDEKTTSDNPYADLAEYDRRGNLCIYLGNNNFIKLPLSLEHRAFYGLGDIAAGLTRYPELRSIDKSLAVDVVNQLSTYSPVDYTDTEVGMKGPVGRVVGVLTPAFAKPIIQSYNNMSWTGRPIQKESKYNGDKVPEYQKAYEGKTTEFGVDVANGWHRLWGGDDVRRAGQKENAAQKVLGEQVTEAIGEYSPAKLQYLFEQGFGETGKLFYGGVSGVWKVGKDVINGKAKDALSMDDFNTRMIPVSKAFFSHSNEQQQFYRARTKYFRYLDKMKDVEYAEREYNKQAKNNPDIELKKQAFEKERAYKQYEVYKRDYKKRLDTLYKQIKEEKDDEKKKSLKMEQNLEMQKMVNALDEIK